MGLHQTIKLLHSKKNQKTKNYQQNKKTAHWMGEDTCK